ncbi:DUF3794 domain-containing protein [Metallumcola ferriviriculae]|uniref:DUF3794 domain-containing protein n=1 Tax=Metallumcola ferriviriculae TaxID=3039180 RepID=A0AAU0UL47_9FIRM|nr:DUF3794 domain-containing protein [Desulfitibacteraceae bacterium MK1]
MYDALFCSTKTPIGDEYCPHHNADVAYYTQISLNGHCTVPGPKPDIEKIINHSHNIIIKKAISIETEEIECGTHLKKGKKVLVAGIFILGIVYISDTLDQKVHYFECKLPFQAIIMCHHQCKEHLFPIDFSLNDYQVHVCVEDLEVCQLDERTVNKNIVLMIWLQPKPCIHHHCREGKK